MRKSPSRRTRRRCSARRGRSEGVDELLGVNALIGRIEDDHGLLVAEAVCVGASAVYPSGLMRSSASGVSPSRRSTTTGVVLEERASAKPSFHSTRTPSIVITSSASSKRASFCRRAMKALFFAFGHADLQFGQEIIAKGPLTLADSQIKKGCIIEKIDGTPIKKDADYYPLLSGKVGKKVMLSVYDPTSKQRFEEQVKAISNGEQSNLLYKRWIENCQETVDKLSNGQIGYVHVRGMNSESFREVYSALLGRCRNKKAVIVDTRHNGGGWLHDDLATLLSGKEYQRFEPRGQYIGSDPYNKWTKPSCVLMCEDNYSNAHGFPWVYKTLGIGKLIGARFREP